MADSDGRDSGAADELGRLLRARLPADADLRLDVGTLAAYTQDASNHRRLPRAVLRPRDADEIAAALAVAAEHGIPVLPRGAGTSIGGQATGVGLVVDCSRYLDRVVAIDPERAEATVQPGAVLDDLRRAAAPHGLTFGPDPSTHGRATIGGMIGNNSCGAHSVAWGRTSDAVRALDVLTADGDRLTLRVSDPTRERPADDLAAGSGDAARLRPHGVAPALPGDTSALDRIRADLERLVAANLAEIRRAFSAPAGMTLTRRVSGYPLDALLPENGFDLARALVGTEGSCVVLLGATVRLVPAPRRRALVVVGFADEYAAADAVPALLPHRPLTVESLSAELLALRATRTPLPLPDGAAWLLLEMDTSDADGVRRAGELAATAPGRALLVTDPAAQAALWRAREDAAGTATRLPGGGEAWPGWEDAAVPVPVLGAYLREFRALLAAHGLRGLPYGHFGEGCVHVRIGFDPDTPRGVAVFERFLAEAAELVTRYGGSCSGEHGDGLARGHLLARQYGQRMVELFGAFKRIWDPRGVLNPGVIVDPPPFASTLRFPSPSSSADTSLGFGYPRDDGSFAKAVRRCVGVGRCVQHGEPARGAAMCPSFQVTRDERHSTRGRAHLLVEMLRGEIITDGWRSADVRQALDLCLGCKACRDECPTGVDVATYKAEFLHQHYAGRVRPAAHYTLGWLPLWLRVAAAAPELANAAARQRSLAARGARLAGTDPRRHAPRLPGVTLRRALRGRLPQRGRPSVLLWPDTFTNLLEPAVGVAAVRVLDAAGFDVRLPSGPVCCGLTWMSTGQLDTAARVSRRAVSALAGTDPIVVLEPSCASALRDDLPDLLGTAASHAVGRRTHSLAGFLAVYAPDWLPAPGPQRAAVGQVHCHQRASTGYADERRLLVAAGVDLTLPQAACCGLAGDFGMTPDHYDVSTACADQGLLSAVRAASDDTLLVCDGFSCRYQLADLTGRRALHSAPILARGPLPAS